MDVPWEQEKPRVAMIFCLYHFRPCRILLVRMLGLDSMLVGEYSFVLAGSGESWG